jgi:hypothetical protein
MALPFSPQNPCPSELSLSPAFGLASLRLTFKPNRSALAPSACLSLYCHVYQLPSPRTCSFIILLHVHYHPCLCILQYARHKLCCNDSVLCLTFIYRCSCSKNLRGKNVVLTDDNRSISKLSRPLASRKSSGSKLVAKSSDTGAPASDDI